MASMIEMDNAEWALVEDLFDPPARRGKARPLPAPAGGRGDPVPRPHGLPVALPPGGIPALGGGTAAAAALAIERGLGEGDDPDRRAEPPGHIS